MGKIRITEYELGGVIKTDRLVESSLEFRNGPKAEHLGPVRLDFYADNADDVQAYVEYLQQLVGIMPLPEKTKKPKLEKTLAPDKMEEVINVGLGKSKTQEDFIDYLRGLNFVFIDTDYLIDLAEKNEFPLELEKKYHKYQWMVRQIKVAKNPMNDKYDFTLMFGTIIVGEKKPKVLIFKGGHFDRRIELHWKDEAGINFKVKEKFYKFPKFMSYEERSKWRDEDRKKQTNPEYEPTKFFLKCEPFVKRLKPLKLK